MKNTHNLSTNDSQSSSNQPFPKVLLGSSSPFRATLLKKLHIDFEQDSPDIDETPLQNEKPQAMVERLTRLKAEALKASYPNHIIISSDQTACLDNQPLGKPHTFENAVKQLQSFSGKTVVFYTGLGVIDTIGRYHQAMDITKVRFRELSNEMIENYIEIEQPLNCAGSFKSEGLGITLFEKVESCDPNALIGLPLIELTSIFHKLGLYLPQKPSAF